MGGQDTESPPPAKKRRVVTGVSDIEAMKRVTAVAAAAAPAPGDELEMLPDGQFRYRVNRAEMIRLLTQSMKELGYGTAAAELETESGIAMEHDNGRNFREAVLEGDWTTACSLFDELRVKPANLARLKFAVLEQKYLELLEQRELKAALYCLREEMSPLRYNVERLHLLCGLVMCRSAEDVKVEAGWCGTGSESRSALLGSIHKLIPTDVMMPTGRLRTLLEQSWVHQCQSCEYHNVSSDAMALLEDHACPRETVPQFTRLVLSKHQDEVWHISFSRSGKLLASASKDGVAIVWDVTDGSVRHELFGHSDAVCYVEWSPDDTQLLTCGSDDDPTVKLWCVDTGKCLRTFSLHNKEVTSCAWCPDGKQFVSGSTDQTLCLWSVEGKLVHSWSTVRASDLAVSVDGRWLVVACHSREVQIYDLSTYAMKSFTETSSITSLSLSTDGDEILLNLSSAEIHTWDIKTRKPLRKYHGHEQGRYQIRSCFGGAGEAFVASGSEDNMVYLWHRQNATLLETLRGHSRSVNCVAWHPLDPGVLASASDDQTIRIWGTEDPSAGDDDRSADGNLGGDRPPTAQKLD
mmetsp:Transcript_14852/g.38086  ORF Transcript_14852/g.38086 Transcript_14852/m.38086 type:complete len:578 (-) Transcript_14852:156-1889(-)